MPVEFTASLVSQPPNLPGALPGHVPKLVDETPLGLEVKLPINEGATFFPLEGDACRNHLSSLARAGCLEEAKLRC
jgi:hypothetical protein